MSKDSSSHRSKPVAPPPQAPPIIPGAQKPVNTVMPATDKVRAAVTWRPWAGVLFVVLWFFIAQFAAGLLLALYPSLRGWSSSQTNDWFSTTNGQFAFVVLAELLTIYGIYWFLRLNKTTFKAIGLIRPRWRDVGIGLIAAPAYFVLYLASITIATYFFPSLNVNQHQDVGFDSVHGAGQLIITFISLAILPPITEEIMVRGLLYSSLKKWLPTVIAVLTTSILFASAHLPEGGSAGPLYIAAIDTFVLSLVLIYLREKTGGLWASITLHFIKNSIAFLALYVLVTT